MLRQFLIRNYALIETLSLDLPLGMTAITGETGAGKSIAIDALQLLLGARASAAAIGDYGDHCLLVADFDLSQRADVQQWLVQEALDQEGNCVLRRSLTKDGRSRAFINDIPVGVQQLRQLGGQLVEIHAQHHHQSLLQAETQRNILDRFGQHAELCRALAQLAEDIDRHQQRLAQQTQRAEEASAQWQLLEFQVEELTILSLQPGEFEDLELELHRLSQAEQWIDNAAKAQALLSEEDTSVLRQLHATARRLATQKSPDLENAQTLIQQAIIACEEAASELAEHQQHLQVDPERLQVVEARISALHSASRKYRVAPEQLPDLWQTLQQQLDNIGHQAHDQQTLARELESLYQRYETTDRALFEARTSAAKKLAASVMMYLPQLALSKSRFTVEVSLNASRAYSAHGRSEVSFQVSTNLGQALQPLAKVISGGELSRISLALQVVIAAYHTGSTLIFDEVDVGIGGGTAQIVGQLLRQLSQERQVICITHLAQVASQAYNHLQVSKQHHTEHTSTEFTFLHGESRVQEIARMIGGITLTEPTLAHARQMLAFEEG